MAKVAYLTDVEGRWDKLLDFCTAPSARSEPSEQRAPLVSYDETRGLRVAEGAVFVFGGDAVDRGPAGRKIIRTLLAAKRAQPDQVVLLAGNRDINKLRLARELDVPRTSGKRADLLRSIFARTMGARDAFEEHEPVVTELAPAGAPEHAFLGLRDERTGRLVKARLARGDYLTYRALEGRRVEQVAATESELARASLVVPRTRRPT